MLSPSSNNSREDTNIIEKYPKRKGVTDPGKAYEHLTSALYALKFVVDDKVDDFQMTTNNKRCGDFDDIDLNVDFKDGKKKRFLFQSKHKLDKEIVTMDLLTKGSFKSGQKEITSHFFVINYLNLVKNFNRDENTFFILYTNRPTVIENGTMLSFNKYVSLLTLECSSLEDKDLLVNSEFTQNIIFQFKPTEEKLDEKETKKSCQQFYFFTNQYDIKTLKKQIQRKMDTMFEKSCDIVSSFVQFMEHWWNENFVLTKHLILAKLTEFALLPYIRTISDKTCNTKTDILKEVIMEFELTILDQTEEEIVRNIWTEIQEECDLELIKFLLQTDRLLTEQQKTITLWYMNKVPLILRVDEENEDLIRTMLKLFRRKIDNKKIILLGKIKRSDFEKWQVFENLLDLMKNCEGKLNIMKEFKVSLQGKPNISLENIVKIHKDIARHLRVSELLKMSQQDQLLIGKEVEKFCDLHIPRDVSVNLIKIKNVQNLCLHDSDDVVIINCNDQFQHKLDKIPNMNIKQLSDYQLEKNEAENCILLSINRKCTRLEFERECRLRKSNVYLLEEFDEHNCILLLQKKSGQKLHFEEKFVSEDLLFDYKGFVNVFCAPPGMGKSRTMKILSHKYAPKETWIIYVNLINCNSFFAKKPNFKEIWKYFLSFDKNENDLTKNMKDVMLKTKRMHLFLDGLDEVNISYLSLVLKFIKNISDQGVHVWVSSRENLRQKITDTLNVVQNKLQPLDQKQQEKFITEKLAKTFKPEDIKEITAAVFNSTDLNKSQELLGVPLQLHIITEMFLSNPEVYKNLHQKNIFVLTRLYQHYFEGKFENYCKKVVSENLTFHLRQYKARILKDYERLALESCFDKSDLEKLYVDEDIEELVRELKRNGDKCGIVTINEYDEVIFDHQTYVEYFTCVWFKRNKKRITLLKEKIFSSRYENLRLLFDLMMAEDNPLHLSVIYKSVEGVKQHKGELHIKDQCGRTALHLTCSYGMKYEENLTYEDFSKRECEEWLQIMDILVQKDTNLYKTDSLYEFDVVTYAVKSKCLYPIEKFLENAHVFEKMKNILYTLYHVDTIAYYAARFGYPNLLTQLVQENPLLINQKIKQGKGLLELAVFGCRDDDYTIPRQGNLAVVNFLLNSGVDVNQTLWNSLTILDESCRLGIHDMLKILSNNGARCSNGDTVLHRLVSQQADLEQIIYIINTCNLDLNATNKKGTNAFQLACKTGNVEVVKILLKNGAQHQHLDSTNQSALHYSVSSSFDNVSVINLLLDNDVPIDAQDDDGQTSLHLASQFGNLKNTMLLLERGADPKILNKMNETVLHCAAKCANNPAVLESLRQEQDLSAKNKDGLTVFHLACHSRSSENVKTVLNYYCLYDLETPLHCVIEFIEDFDEDIITNVLEWVDINAQDTNGVTVLHMACEKNDFDCTNFLLDNNANVNIIDDEGKTALHYAVEENASVDLIKLLLFKNVDINAKDSLGVTALHVACENCNFEVVEILVDGGADVFAVDNDLQNAYFYILNNEEVDENIIKLLVECGVDINGKNKFGLNPLDEAKTNSDKSIVKLLSKYGAKENTEKQLTFLLDCRTGQTEKVMNFLLQHDCFSIVDKDGNNALHYASLSEKDNEEIISLLISKDFNVNAKNKRGSTALHYGCEVGNYTNVKVLICSGADINSLDSYGYTPLHKALDSDNLKLETVVLLLDSGADVNASNEEETTVLHVACESGNVNVFQELLDRGAKINILDNDGCNVLHYASWGEDKGTELIQLLLNQDIDVNFKDKTGSTALHYACLYENVEKIYFLINANTDINASKNDGETALHIACTYGNLRLVKELITKGAQVTAINNKNESALHYATFQTNLNTDIVDLLLEELDVNSLDKNGATPLHHACINDNFKIAKHLLNIGAKKNMGNNLNQTALHLASFSGHTRMVELLLRNRLDINAKDENGATPLHLACLSGKFNTVVRLIQEGADVHCLDNNNKTLLHYAAEALCSNKQIIDFLLEKGLDFNSRNVSGCRLIDLAYNPLNKNFFVLQEKESQVGLTSRAS